LVLIRPCATRCTTIHIYYLSHIYRYVGTYVSYTHILNYAFMVNNPYLGLSAPPPRCKKAKMSCTHGGLTGRRRIQSTVVASTQSVFRTDSDRQLSFEPRSACWFYFNGPITIAIRARFEYDSTTIRARYNILRGVMCFRAIINMSILSRCCRML